MPIISSLAALSAKGFGAGLSDPVMGGSGFIDTSAPSALSNGLIVSYGATDSAGNFYFINSTNSATGSYGYIAKVNSAGSVVWSNRVYFGSTFPALNFTSIYIDASDNIFIGCNTSPGYPGIPAVLKLTTNGATSFAKTTSNIIIPPNPNNNYNAAGGPIVNMTSDSSGNIYALTYPYATDPSQYGYVLKYDSAGSSASVGRYNSAGGLVGTARKIVSYSTNLISFYIVPTGAGEVAVISTTNTGSFNWSFGNNYLSDFAVDSINGYVYVFTNNAGSLGLTKLNITTGAVIWSVTASSAIGNTYLLVDSFGNIHLIGRSSLPVGIKISKFDSSGNLLYENILNSADPIYSVSINNNNLIISTSTYTSPSSGFYNVSSKYYSLPISGKIPIPGTYTGGYTYYRNNFPTTWTSGTVSSYSLPISINFGSSITSGTPSVNNVSTAAVTITTLAIGS